MPGYPKSGQPNRSHRFAVSVAGADVVGGAGECVVTGVLAGWPVHAAIPATTNAVITIVASRRAGRIMLE